MGAAGLGYIVFEEDGGKLTGKGPIAKFIPEDGLAELARLSGVKGGDALFFAVATDFPQEILPEDTGLIVADRFGGEILRQAPEHRLAPARRKALTLHYARLAAARLSSAFDPHARFEPLPRE